MNRNIEAIFGPNEPESNELFYDNDDTGRVEIADESLTWALMTADFVVGQQYIDDIGVFVALTRQLVKANFLEQQEGGGKFLEVKQPFTVTKPGYRNEFGLFYPKMTIDFTPNKPYNHVELMKEIREKAEPDFDA